MSFLLQKAPVLYFKNLHMLFRLFLFILHS